MFTILANGGTPAGYNCPDKTTEFNAMRTSKMGFWYFIMTCLLIVFQVFDENRFLLFPHLSTCSNLAICFEISNLDCSSDIFNPDSYWDSVGERMMEIKGIVL